MDRTRPWCCLCCLHRPAASRNQRQHGYTHTRPIAQRGTVLLLTLKVASVDSRQPPNGTKRQRHRIDDGPTSSPQLASQPPNTMNYLKSITTSVLNSTGVSFPFSIGERIPGLEAGSTIWDIREGVKKVCVLACWRW